MLNQICVLTPTLNEDKKLALAAEMSQFELFVAEFFNNKVGDEFKQMKHFMFIDTQLEDVSPSHLQLYYQLRIAQNTPLPEALGFKTVSAYLDYLERDPVESASRLKQLYLSLYSVKS